MLTTNIQGTYEGSHIKKHMYADFVVKLTEAITYETYLGIIGDTTVEGCLFGFKSVLCCNQIANSQKYFSRIFFFFSN